MDNTNRISEIIKSFGDLWMKIDPEESFGHIVDDFSRFVYQDTYYGDLCYVEDDEIIELFKQYLDNHNIK